MVSRSEVGLVMVAKYKHDPGNVHTINGFRGTRFRLRPKAFGLN
jgi:hypothetical protein